MSEPQAPPQPRRRWLSKARLELILAVSAIFISAMSLLVAIRTEQSQRATLAASVWPFPQRNLDNRFGSDRQIAIAVSNDGVGPAKIKSFEMALDGKPLSSTNDLLRRCCGYAGPRAGDAPRLRTVVGSAIDNTVLRAGEVNGVIRLSPSAGDGDLSRRLSAALPRLSFRGCYCSVLDECWTSDLASVQATPVDTCPPPAHPFDPFGK